MKWKNSNTNPRSADDTQPMPLSSLQETQSMPTAEQPVYQHIEWRDPERPGQYTPANPAPLVPAPAPVQTPAAAEKKQKPRRRGCCLSCSTWLIVPLILLGFYFFTPVRTNLLILGIDRTPDGTALGRSDTMILASIIPLKPTVNLLSIPRDLWVEIPGVGENRINTAHYFAEIEKTGSGPAAAANCVEQNFGVPVKYTVRLRFDGFLSIIEAMGGVDVTLTKTMAGYEPGTYHLDPDEALAFARDRKGTDDFFRMENIQFLILSSAKQMMQPASWPRIPQVAAAILQSVDTNIPVWQWPRLGLALLRAELTGVNHQTITRDMTTPFTTDGGAEVLAPNWDAIKPLIKEMFEN